MYATQTNVIRGLTKIQYSILREMCMYSNNLYNVALYSIRQHYFVEKQFLTFESNYHVCKNNENYKLLQADISTQILRAADRSFKSFFNLIKKCRLGDYRYTSVKLPSYRKKGGLFVLIIPVLGVVKNDKFLLPVSRTFKKLHPEFDKIELDFPKRLSRDSIKEIRILPCNNGAFFKIQYVYEIEKEDSNAYNRDNVLAIDLGVDNLATCVSTTGTPFIIDGRKLKSINHQWNKEKARLQSIAMKQGCKLTARMQQITERRNNRINDMIKKCARVIINYCITNNIGTVVIGYSKNFKQNCNLGKVNNQNFIQIPFGNLRNQIKFLCWRYNIEYIEQEESYTSKSSFLDNDPIPEYKPEQPFTGKFSGRRIHRGLYKSANGAIINADVNGAANIMRKCKQNVDFDKLCNGLLASPCRIRLS